MMQTSSSGIKKAPAKAIQPARLNSIGAVFTDTVLRCKNPLILYFIAMFIFGPVSLLIGSGRNYKGLLYLLAPLLPMGFLVPAGASVVIPLVVFAYLDNKRALDVFHALPVTRGKMFTGNFLAGLAMLFAPFLTMIVPVGLAIDLNQRYNSLHSEAGYVYENSYTFEYLPATLSLAAAVFFCYVLMTLLVICCSTLLESVGYFAIILLGYVGLVKITFDLVGSATFGYTGFPLEEILMRFSPLSVLDGAIAGNGMRNLQLFLTALVLLFICYRRILARKSEQVGGGYVWPPVYYIAAIGGSIAVGLVFSMAFGADSVGNVILSIAAGVLAYAILDTIRNRGFKNIVRTGIVSACGIAGVGIFVLIINLTGTFGYERWMPKESEITAVQVDLSGETSILSMDYDFPMSDPESIERVLAAHQSILANQGIVESGAIRPDPLVEYTPYAFDKGDPAYTYGSKRVEIIYTLKNGKQVSRRYYNVPTSLTRPLADLAGSQAYACSMADRMQKYADYLSGLTPEQKNHLDTYYMSTFQLQPMDMIGAGVYEENLSLTREMEEKLVRAFASDLRARPEGWRVNPDTQPIGRLYINAAIVDNPNIEEVRYTSGNDWFSYTFYLYETDVGTLSYLQQLGYYDAGKNELLPNRTYTYNDSSIVVDAIVLSTEYYDAFKSAHDGDVFHFAGGSCGIYAFNEDDLRDENGKVTREPVPSTISDMDKKTVYRYFIGYPEDGGIEVTDQMVTRAFTEEELESLRKLTLQVAISDEPLDVLSLNGCSYLIPKENVSAVKAIVYGK